MSHKMGRSLWLLFVIFLGCVMALVASAAYWQVVRGPELALDERNPRLREEVAHGYRGGIYAAGGEGLALSLPSQTGFRRVYRGTPGLASTIGYATVRYGASGLELAAFPYLAGRDGVGVVARLLSGRWAGPRRGANVYTTLRLPVQVAAERSMGGRRGAVVALDPRSGEILALVSLPGYDPGRLEDEWPSLVRNPESPLVNRALQGLYPPGSTYKVAIAASALEAGVATPESRYDCLGVRHVGQDTIRDYGGQVHGPLNLDEALAVSCNYVFSGLAMQLTPAQLGRTLQALGLREALSLELPVARARTGPLGTRPEERAELGIGQGSVVVTPLAMAEVAAIIANGGRRVSPRLIASVRYPRGPELWRQPERPPVQAISGRTAAAVTKMMVGVVARGTGVAAAVPGVSVAGKTGSAENPHGASHAWFVGFAPAEAPRVAVAVIIENAGSGGGVAAPVAHDVLAAALVH